MDRFLIIDANSIINRAFYAIHALTNKDGLNTNGIYGFLNIMLKEIEEEKPTHIACAFDVSRVTFRTALYSEYKGTRGETPQELREQFQPLKDLLTAMNIVVLEKNNYEADDIIGTISKMCSDEKKECVILTGDKDDLQLINDFVNVKLIITTKGKTQTIKTGEVQLFEKYGLKPKEMIELKALMGDSSDNIPGVKGVGEVSGTKLVKEYCNLENIYENIDKIKGTLKDKLINDRDNAFLSRTIGTIKCDVPLDIKIEDCLIKSYDTKRVKEQLEYLEFGSFINKFNLQNDDIPIEVEEITVHKDESIKYDSEDKLFFYVNENEVYLNIANKIYETTKDNLKFKEALLNERIMKVSFNVKALLHNGVEIKGDFSDISIMGYVCDSKNKDSDFDNLFVQYLNINTNNPVEKISLFPQLYSKLLEIIGDTKTDYINLLEHTLVSVLFNMEYTGVKIDKAKLDELSFDFKSEIDVLTEKIYILAGEKFNISSPKQLGEILFEKLSLPTSKKTKTGYSTNAEVLENLTGTHEIIEYIKDYRLITKLSSTYLEGFRNSMDENDIIHTTFNQTLTQTGRLSSTEPNLQNIPIRTPLGKKIRSVVIPKNDIFVSADYSQIELRVLAHISDDENLKTAFLQNEDIHTKTAQNIFETEQVDANMRRMAKAINFGLIYGKGAFSLAKDLKISRKEASEYIDKYLGQYKNVCKYMTDVITDATQNGYTATLYGRRRYFPELKATNKMVKASGERSALNSPIQGTAADIMKIAMIKVYDCLQEKKLKSKLVLQIHDELIIDCVNEEVDIVSKLLKENMQDAVSLAVPLTVSLECDTHL